MNYEAALLSSINIDKMRENVRCSNDSVLCKNGVLMFVYVLPCLMVDLCCERKKERKNRRESRELWSMFERKTH